MITHTKTPENLTLNAIMARFGTDEAAREYLEKVRWPNGPVCPHCNNSDATKLYDIAPNPAKKSGRAFASARVRRVVHRYHRDDFWDSKIPLRKWLVAWYMLCTSKKGVRALQFQRMLELGRVPLRLVHDASHSLRVPRSDVRGQARQVAVRSWRRTKHTSGEAAKRGGPHKRGRGTKKIPVVALVERGGRVGRESVKKVTGEPENRCSTIILIRPHDLLTDELPAYRAPGMRFASHQTVNHGSKEYVRGDVHIKGRGVLLIVQARRDRDVPSRRKTVHGPVSC